MGFILDEDVVTAIGKELVDLSKIKKIYPPIFPDIISCRFPTNSLIPIASVCFGDSGQMVYHANFALGEYHRNKIWYFEKRNPPNEITGRVLCRFYLDDVALRLYPAAEHMANGIIDMLEIDKNEIITEKKKDSLKSLQSVLGNYLKRKKPEHEITNLIRKLAENDAWKKAINYRNKWVHEQPPTIDGLGIVYNREKRWESYSNKNFPFQSGLTVGGGDEPDYKIEDIHDFVKPALFLFVDTLSSIGDYYLKILNDAGIYVGEDKEISF